MGMTVNDQVCCVDCSDWCGLYDWKGEPRGGICEQVGEWEPKPKHGDWFQLSCHSIWERFEVGE